MKQPSPKQHVKRSQLIVMCLLLVALYVLLPQLGAFRQSFSALRTVSVPSVLAVTTWTIGTYLAAAATYYFLAWKPLRYGRTLLIQVAGMFVNRLIPAGLGGIGVNYDYLRRSHHTATEASTVVAANNSMGFAGNAVLLLLAVTIQPKLFSGIQLHQPPALFVGIAVGCLGILVATIALSTALRDLVVRILKRFGRQFMIYRQRPWDVAAAFSSSLLVTLCNVAALWASLQAVHAALDPLQVLFVFSFGIALGTAAPTPGGLGGVEAGLIGGLWAYHVSSPAALAAVLLFRLVSYWGAIFVGAATFAYARRKQYI